MNKTIRVIFFLCIMILVFSCSEKKSNQKELMTYQENQSISHEEALYGIGKIIFADKLKTFKAEKNSAGKQDVTIEYGGDRAYTFYTEGNYSDRIQLDIVRLILMYAAAAKKRELGNLRISLVKPYYVKEPDAKKEIVEEFEIFRVSISLSDLSQIPDWDNSKLVVENKNANNANIVEKFNQVRLRWKIELNELSRVELK